MRRLLLILLLLTTPLFAQFTTVTATVHDPSNVTYANGSYSASWIPPAGWTNIVPAVAGNGATFIHTFAGTLDSSGHFSVSLADTNQITPTTSSWSITVCPNPGYIGCTNYTGVITGGAQDISAQLNASAPNIIPQSAFPRGVGLGLVIPLPQATKGTIAVAINGSSATDCTVGLGTFHVFCEFNGTAWVSFGGGGGTTFPLLAPDGIVSAPSYSFVNAPGMGLWKATATQLVFEVPTGGSFLYNNFNSNIASITALLDTNCCNINWSSSNGMSFASGGNRGVYWYIPGLSPDTGITKDAAGVVDVGNGTQGDKSGTIKAAAVTFTNNTTLADTAAGRVTAGANTLEQTPAGNSYWMNDWTGSQTAGEASVTSNAIKLWAITVPGTYTVTQLCWGVSTADNTANTYDYGLYNSSGNLTLHIGPNSGTTFAPNNGPHCINTTASTVVTPGRYYIAMTTNCAATCAALNGPGNLPCPVCNATSSTTSTGGTLPASVVIPADTWNYTAGEPMFVMHN